jgi:hypothetical protein
MDRVRAIFRIAYFLDLLEVFEARANDVDLREHVFSRIKWFIEKRAEYLNPRLNGKPLRKLSEVRYSELEDALSRRPVSSNSNDLYFSEAEMDQLLLAYEQYLEAWLLLSGLGQGTSLTGTFNKGQTIGAAKKALSAKNLKSSDLADATALRTFLDPLVFSERQRGNGVRAFGKGRQIYMAFTKWPGSFSLSEKALVNLRLNILIRIGYAAYQHELSDQLVWFRREVEALQKDHTDFADLCDLVLLQHEGYQSATSDAPFEALMLDYNIKKSNYPFFGYSTCEGGLLHNAGTCATGLGYDFDAKVDKAGGLSVREMLVRARELDIDDGDFEGAAFSAGGLARALDRAKHHEKAMDVVNEGLAEFAQSGVTAPYAFVSLLKTRASIYFSLSKKSNDLNLARLAGADSAAAFDVAKKHGLAHLAKDVVPPEK